VAGHGQATRDLNTLRAERKISQVESEGTVPGEIEALPADADADHYVVVKKKDTEPPADEKEGDEGAKGDEQPKEQSSESEQNNPKEGSKPEEDTNKKEEKKQSK
jgi:hypothetical protein